MAEAKRDLITNGGAHKKDQGWLAKPGDFSGQPFHPLVELTLTRIREFTREREAVFWVFVFPVLLAFALGIAFRNTAPEKLRIAVENDQSAATSNAPQIAAALSRSSDIETIL